MRQTKSIRHILVATAAVHLAAIAAATTLPELGDEPSFKVWANRAAEEGIHAAYRNYGYDWLPLYLYVSRAVGLFWHASGFAGAFGTYHHALVVLLKLTMTAFHLAAVWLVYSVARRVKPERAAIAAALFGLAPGTVLATAAFGYQDAFHTLLLVAALWCVAERRMTGGAVLTVLAALTKPQAVLFLGPFWLVLLCERGWLTVLKAGMLSAAAGLLVVSPFLFYGTALDVVRMITEVPRVHQWLTGCAHNVWWLIAPVPPFLSDREPLVLGLSGLRLGLATFAGFCGVVGLALFSERGLARLAHACAFLAFAFFMVVTQIHENHLYACFPFLAVACAADRKLVGVFGVLTLTFAADLVLTLYLLNTDVAITLGPVRLSLVNAAVNTVVLAAWTSRYVREEIVVGWMKRSGRGVRPQGGDGPRAARSAANSGEV